MIIAHSRPAGIAWTVSGAGATLIGPAANLADGRPGTVAALTWLTGTQNTASVLRLRGEWTGGAIAPGFVGLSNVILPVGTKVQVSFRRAADAAGTYPYVPSMQNNGQRVFLGPRGERTAWIWVDANASPVVGVEIAIFNDVNGAATIAAAAPFWIGEAWVSPAVEIDIDDEWTPGSTDPTTTNLSGDKQPYTNPGVVYRQMAFKLVGDDATKYFGDPAAPGVVDYEQLFAKLDRGQSGVYVPRYKDSTGAFSAHLLHRTAIIGVAQKLPKLTHRIGPMFDSDQVTVLEAPIPT